MAVSDYELSFAGIGLRLPPPDFLQHLDRHDWRRLVRPVLPRSPVWPGPRFSQLGLADPLATPDLQFGDYFYPVGASRWSIACALAAPDDVAAITKLVWPGTGSSVNTGLFKIYRPTDDTDAAVQTYLTLLPPVPIVQTDTGTQAYLLTFVDERYFWHQWQNAGIVTCTGATATWTGLINQLATQLGITIAFTTPDAAYGVPEPDSALYTNYESPAVLLDAAAANVGCAVVRNFDGTYKLQAYADALAAATANRPANLSDVLGGPAFTTPASGSVDAYRAQLPNAVTLVLPKWVDGRGYYEPTDLRTHVTDSYGAVYAITTTLASLGAPYSSCQSFAGAKVLHSTYKARFTASSDAAPNNLTACQALAARLAKDYYDGRLTWLDETFAGIRAWTPEGASDVLYSWRDGVTTRIMAPPFNSGQAEFQHGIAAVSGMTAVTMVERVCQHPSSQVSLSSTDHYAFPTLNDSTWYDLPGLQIGPLDSGTWMLYGDLSPELLLSAKTSASDYAYIECRLYDATAAAAVSNSERMLIQHGVIDSRDRRQITPKWYLKPTVSTSYKVQARVLLSGTPTIPIISTEYQARIMSNADGRTDLAAVPVNLRQETRSLTLPSAWLDTAPKCDDVVNDCCPVTTTPSGGGAAVPVAWTCGGTTYTLPSVMALRVTNINGTPAPGTTTGCPITFGQRVWMIWNGNAIDPQWHGAVNDAGEGKGCEMNFTLGVRFGGVSPDSRGPTYTNSYCLYLGGGFAPAIPRKSEIIGCTDIYEVVFIRPGAVISMTPSFVFDSGQCDAMSEAGLYTLTAT